MHVVRCFEDADVVHVDGDINPLRDVETINLELALADLAQAEKRLQRVNKDRNASQHEKSALEKVVPALEAGNPARSVSLTEDEEAAVKGLMLLTAKPIIYGANVADSDLAEGNEMVEQLREYATKENARVVVVSAQVESELVELDGEDKAMFLESLGVTEDSCGLRALVREAYELLSLRTYFTSGETETRAWTIRKGWKAPQAAGVIHTDFEKGFIRAQTISYKDMVECGSEKIAREKGLMRAEGKEYVVEEGDVMTFLHSN